MIVCKTYIAVLMYLGSVSTFPAVFCHNTVRDKHFDETNDSVGGRRHRSLDFHVSSILKETNG